MLIGDAKETMDERAGRQQKSPEKRQKRWVVREKKRWIPEVLFCIC